MVPLFVASIFLLIAEESVLLLCINFISVKLSVNLFECYNSRLVRCIDTCWCYLKGDINCNYDYYRKHFLLQNRCWPMQLGEQTCQEKQTLYLQLNERASLLHQSIKARLARTHAITFECFNICLHHFGLFNVLF